MSPQNCQKRFFRLIGHHIYGDAWRPRDRDVPDRSVVVLRWYINGRTHNQERGKGTKEILDSRQAEFPLHSLFASESIAMQQ